MGISSKAWKVGNTYGRYAGAAEKRLDIAEDNSVQAFREKNMGDGNPINAGYMVLSPKIFDYIEDDQYGIQTWAVRAACARRTV